MDDTAHEVNVPRPEPARLCQTQADKGAEQYGRPDALGKQVVKLPDLLGGCHVHPLLRQVRNQDTLICGGCKSNIHLLDYLGQYRKAEGPIRRPSKEGHR